MTKMRRKPTVVEMIQFKDENEAEIYAAFGGEFFTLQADSSGTWLEFDMDNGQVGKAPEGFWIAPGAVPGTFYPIDPEFVEANYEPFNYDEELTEESDLSDVVTKVRSTLMRVLPYSQVQLAMQKMGFEPVSAEE